MIQLAVIELAVPVLSAATTFLGSAVLGYRLQRRAKGIKSAVIQRVKDARALREVVGDIKGVKEAITGGVDEKKALDLIKGLIAKHGVGKDVPPATNA